MRRQQPRSDQLRAIWTGWLLMMMIPVICTTHNSIRPQLPAMTTILLYSSETCSSSVIIVAFIPRRNQSPSSVQLAFIIVGRLGELAKLKFKGTRISSADTFVREVSVS